MSSASPDRWRKLKMKHIELLWWDSEGHWYGSWGKATVSLWLPLLQVHSEVSVVGVELVTKTHMLRKAGLWAGKSKDWNLPASLYLSFTNSKQWWLQIMTETSFLPPKCCLTSLVAMLILNHTENEILGNILLKVTKLTTIATKSFICSSRIFVCIKIYILKKRKYPSRNTHKKRKVKKTD